jgi:hypothetical protein
MPCFKKTTKTKKIDNQNQIKQKLRNFRKSNLRDSLLAGRANLSQMRDLTN